MSTHFSFDVTENPCEERRDIVASSISCTWNSFTATTFILLVAEVCLTCARYIRPKPPAFSVSLMISYLPPSKRSPLESGGNGVYSNLSGTANLSIIQMHLAPSPVLVLKWIPSDSCILPTLYRRKCAANLTKAYYLQ